MTDKPSILRLRFETIGTLAAIMVGVIAIFVSWDQARVMRAQQHASVLPAIQIDGFVSENNGRASIGMRMRNNGVGPALIHDFEVRVADQDVYSWDELTAMAPPRAGRNWSSVTGRVLGQGEEITPIELFWTIDPDEDPAALLDFVNAMTRNTQISVCYCSVFERCFISRTVAEGALLPEPVEACPNTTRWDNRVTLGTPQSAASE